MAPTRFFSIIAWILLPTVVFGGYSLLQLMIAGDVLTPAQVTYFRAGHGHAGVLILAALLYHSYLDKTTFSERTKWLACGLMLVSVLAVSGGFFLHVGLGAPEENSAGTIITATGAGLLSLDAFFLAYGLIRHPQRSLS